LQSGSDYVDRPTVGEAFEIVFTVVGEGQFAANDEVFDGARDEYFSGSRKARDPCREGDSESGDVVVAALDFAGM
jgi:hypothetical protein